MELDPLLEPGLGDLIERFDHLAVAVHDIDRALPLVRLLGGSLLDAGDSTPNAFRWAQFRLPGDVKLELIQPLSGAGDDHFLVRFLARRGEGLHHVTVKVASLDEAMARCEALGYRVVDADRSQSNWKEAFVHPRSASGVLVQLAEWNDMPQREVAVADVLEGVTDRYL
jgi:methylmalonyl-CoA epimerase